MTLLVFGVIYPSAVLMGINCPVVDLELTYIV